VCQFSLMLALYSTPTKSYPKCRQAPPPQQWNFALILSCLPSSSRLLEWGSPQILSVSKRNSIEVATGSVRWEQATIVWNLCRCGWVRLYSPWALTFSISLARTSQVKQQLNDVFIKWIFVLLHWSNLSSQSSLRWQWLQTLCYWGNLAYPCTYNS
jgi:hypothetical protein